MPAKTVPFTCSLDAETIALLRDLSARLDLSMSQLLRRLIREAANNPEREVDLATQRVIDGLTARSKKAK